MTPNIIALAPIPSASVMMMAADTPGVFQMPRTAARRFCVTPSHMQGLHSPTTLLEERVTFWRWEAFGSTFQRLLRAIDAGEVAFV